MFSHPNLVFWANGQTFNDGSKSALAGTANLATLTTGGIRGNSINLAVSPAAYVDYGVPAALAFERTNSFSISLWVMGAGISSDRQVIISKATAVATQGWMVTCSSSGKIELLLVSAWTGNMLGGWSNVAANASAWKHFVFVYDGSSKAENLVMYVDGVKLPNITATYPSAYDNLSATILNTRSVRLGCPSDATTRSAPLSVDDIQIYSGLQLSQSDVVRIMHGMHPLARV